MKFYISLLMAAVISNVPHIAVAKVAGKMISTAEVVQELSREQAMAKVNTILSHAEVREKLVKLGLTQDEISKRMATLSDVEMQKFADQLDQAQFAGDGVVGILVIVVLVLLVIYLAKRV